MLLVILLLLMSMSLVCYILSHTVLIWRLLNIIHGIRCETLWLVILKMLPLITKRRFPLDQGGLLVPAKPHAFSIKLLLLLVHVLEDLVHSILIVAFIPNAARTLTDAEADWARVLPILLPYVPAVNFISRATVDVANVQVSLRSQFWFVVV